MSASRGSQTQDLEHASSSNPVADPVRVSRPQSPQPLSASVDGGGYGLVADRISDPSLLLLRLPQRAQTYYPDAPASAVRRPDYQRQNTAGTGRQSHWTETRPGHHSRTIQERIEPTLEHAKSERIRCELKARLTGYALNKVNFALQIAIGLQVLFGALTTGVAAATTGRSTSIATSVLGGMTTLVASYVARARGSNEPELSITRVKDLDQLIRECEILMMDYGTVTGNEHRTQLSADFENVSRSCWVMGMVNDVWRRFEARKCNTLSLTSLFIVYLIPVGNAIMIKKNLKVLQIQ
ncbi:carbamoyl-phosphate synth [Favolaschia claudopus]|uniref:Carbamoyl-phosphate synth n=1 Tax=Favolaschia claudopus TaxID=2862362 RepID=A0AAV9ZU66_9AGAR